MNGIRAGFALGLLTTLAGLAPAQGIVGPYRPPVFTQSGGMVTSGPLRPGGAAYSPGNNPPAYGFRGGYYGGRSFAGRRSYGYGGYGGYYGGYGGYYGGYGGYYPYYNSGYSIGVFPSPYQDISPPAVLQGIGGPVNGVEVAVSGQMTAQLTVALPTSGDLWLNNQHQPTSGPTFNLTSPTLDAGQSYTFPFRAEWVVDGTRYRVDKTVQVAAGERQKVTLILGDPVQEK